MHSKIDDLSGYTSQLKPDDLINTQFTSGTTGFPEDATLTHRNLLNNRYLIGKLLGYTETDRIRMPVPFFHTSGMAIGIFAVFTRGTTIAIPAPSSEARETPKTMHSAKATSLYGVSTMFINGPEEAHNQKGCGSPCDLSMLRTGAMAGTSRPSKTMRDVMDELNMRKIAICYGMAETSSVPFQARVDPPLERHVNAVGQIIPHLGTRITCEKTGKTLSRDEQSRVAVRGYSVMEEYWERPGKTAEAVDADGWVHTGDLGALDNGGYLFITGRIKDMLIRGGENIYLREIEELLFTHPAVVGAQVISAPDDRCGEEIMAWVILHDDVEDLIAEDVTAFTHGKLSCHRIPCYVHVVGELPMTASSKVRKVEMHKMTPRVLGWA